MIANRTGNYCNDT